MESPRAYQKLRNSGEFRVVYEKGQRYHSPYFSIFILPRPEAGTRIGITVTRKVGNAVVRNRCKRRLREAARNFFRQAQWQGSLPAGVDLVINAKSELIRADFQQLEEAFARCMKRYFDWLEKHADGRAAEAAK
jgi:ribonuclease P protein component